MNRTELETALRRARLHDLAKAEAQRLRREAIAAAFGALAGALHRAWHGRWTTPRLASRPAG